MTTLKRVAMAAGPFFGVVLFLIAAAALHHALRDLHHREIVRELREMPVTRGAFALALAALSYLALMAGDALAWRYVRRPLAASRIALTSFVASAFSNNLGFGLLSGAPVRFRLYSEAGASAIEITKVIAFGGVTFFLGLCTVAGAVFLFEPLTIPALLHRPFASLRPVGAIFLSFVAAYVLWSVWGRKALHVAGWEIPPPPARFSVAQVVLSSFDWLAAGGALFVLLDRPGGPSFPAFVGIFMLAQTGGVISNIPGGVGVFEAIILALLTPVMPVAPVLSALLIYRGVYYLLPLLFATGLLGAAEMRNAHLPRGIGAFAHRTAAAVPHFLSFTTFVSGLLLLVSGATPAEHGRLGWLREMLPLPIIETSHFLASMAGAALLILARGLQRRLDAAWLFSAALLGTGAVLSLLKGFDYEEAIVLGLMLAILLRSRPCFDRRASLLAEPFTPVWTAAILMALAGSIWLGIFAHRHAEYTHELWWQFALMKEASRSLRASVGAGAVLALFGLARLLRPVFFRPPSAGPDAQEKARAIIGRASQTYPHLALLGDKTLLFSDLGNAFLMYARSRRSCVAMSDPVGPEREADELAWQFHDACKKEGTWPVFMEVGPHHLDRYLDLGLALLKLGEEALVPLEAFSLEISARKNLRNAHHKMVREGLSFEVVAPVEVASHLPVLREISDAWLAEKDVHEKGFSMGRFDPDYLRQCPIALVRKSGRVLAFTNLWLGAAGGELSIDLMRHRPDAPNGVMDYLFVELLLWGRAAGYRWFNLGLAPLSGLDEHPGVSPWNRLATLLYRHGEHFYNFRGLRRYKEKFDPTWEPRYLAAPGGLALPSVLADVATLVAGGVKGLVTR